MKRYKTLLFLGLTVLALAACREPVDTGTSTLPNTVAPTTVVPTVVPTAVPSTIIPTVKPSVSTTIKPTELPTVAPTTVPTQKPTVAPTTVPTQKPTVAPTVIPTPGPTTIIPTVVPTISTPPVIPTQSPTGGDYPSENTFDIWVSPDGNDANQGTKDAPFKTLYQAISVVNPGETIYMKKGTYPMSERLTLDFSGAKDAPITIQAENWDEVILDYSTQPYGHNNSQYVGIYLKGNYWKLQGLTICHAGDNGIKVEGSFNYIGRCTLHHNGDTGIQLGFGHNFSTTGFGNSNDGSYCSYNTIENCDSYLNYDFDNWGDADGYACKMHNGMGNVFKGCRAWSNVDDAWDLYETDYSVILIDCWAWGSAKKTDFSTDEYFSNADYLKMKSSIKTIKVPNGVGNGNGIKFGGNGTGGNSKGTHYAYNCVSFHNDKGSSCKGFDENNHKDGVVLENCVGWDNGYNFMFEQGGTKTSFSNCISFYTGTRGTSYNKPNRLAGELGAGGTLFNNNFIYDEGDLVHQTMFTIDDFITLTVEAAMAPRQADGSLPNNGFARLKTTSPYYGLGMGLI